MARHSLLIGVQDYHGNGLTPLSCALADIDLMASFLDNPDYQTDESRVTAIPDPTYAEATRAIRDFLGTIQRNDVVVIYFSGHGMRDTQGDLFLCMRDSDVSDLEWSALAFRRLARTIQERNLRRVLIILDCCYSGAAGLKDSLQSKLDEAQQDNGDGTGVFLLSSAGQAETSKEGDTHSIFTDVLANGILSGDADMDGDGKISVQELAEYVAHNVPGDQTRQKPQISSKAAHGTFVVAENAARRAEIARQEIAALARDWTREARARLGQAFGTKDVDGSLLAEVDEWTRTLASPDLADPRLIALRDYGKGDIGLMGFLTAWQGTNGTSHPTETEAEAELVEGASATEAEADTTAGDDASDTGEIILGIVAILIMFGLIGTIGYFGVTWLWGLFTSGEAPPSDIVPMAEPSPPVHVPENLQRYADWAVGYKILVLIGAAYAAFVMLAMVLGFVEAAFDTVWSIEDAMPWMIFLLLIGGAIYMLLIADRSVGQQFEALFLWIMSGFDAVINLFR